MTTNTDAFPEELPKNRSIAEAIFRKFVKETFQTLQKDLPPGFSRKRLARAINSYLGFAGKNVRVLVGGREDKLPASMVVRLLERKDREIEIVDWEAAGESVVHLEATPDLISLRGWMERLYDHALGLGLFWNRAEPIVRNFAKHLASVRRSRKRRGSTRRQPTKGSRRRLRTIARRQPLRGERDPGVAARRAELRNMLSSRRGRPPTEKVCKRWDFKSIAVPERWHEQSITNWIDALNKRPGNVQKLVSTDIKRIRQNRQ